MTQDELRRRTNERFGRLLRSTRAASGKSIGEIAASLEMSELELKRAENRPAQTPCRKLYRIIEFYGPEAVHGAELAFQEVDRLGRRFRATQVQENGLKPNANPIGRKEEEIEAVIQAFGEDISLLQLSAVRTRQAKPELEWKKSRGHSQAWTTPMWLILIAFIYEATRTVFKGLLKHTESVALLTPKCFKGPLNRFLALAGSVSRDS